MNQITTNYDTLIHRVKNHGNIDAYDELFYGFIDANENERTDSVLKYSKVMAEKFNYERAYFDYFGAFEEKYNVKVDFKKYSSIDISKVEKAPREEATELLKNMIREKMMTQEQFDSIKK